MTSFEVTLYELTSYEVTSYLQLKMKRLMLMISLSFLLLKMCSREKTTEILIVRVQKKPELVFLMIKIALMMVFWCFQKCSLDKIIAISLVGQLLVMMDVVMSL